jgi:superfamily II DNA or RNA helicase/HKD family nuclease/diadenosine tetraphosphate (Ap4A) HIT family hydrolase
VSETAADCPFCCSDPASLFLKGPIVAGVWDRFPVSPGHALLFPRRHIPTWFDAADAERIALVDAIGDARAIIDASYHPAGYNIGINVGLAAGQTVFHLHVHLIPRYDGDVPEPRGGVRGVIPGKADYSAGMVQEAARPYEVQRRVPPDVAFVQPPHGRSLVTGGNDDPLLPHLRAHLAAARGLDVAVAFVLGRGLVQLGDDLADLLERGGRLRFLTGDYLGVTEPDALQRLLDLETVAITAGAPIELRILETGGGSFHPKAYIVHLPNADGVAFVGSSNVSEAALTTGIEWNYRVIPARDRAGFATVRDAFEALFHHKSTHRLTTAWLEAYRRRRLHLAVAGTDVAPEPLPPPPEPHPVQEEALAALAATRARGNAAGLVVLGTGLGKTWLAAFDSHRPEYQRVLFVAHREEILSQALSTFRRIRPTAALGLYTGDERAPDAEVLFASIQTLGRMRHLGQFARDAFDYIVVDEFHHAAATTYRRLIEHFTPRFLLGLTATPERADGGDLLVLCGENLVYRCGMLDGIRRGLLVPFRYFGVPDEVDYRNIPWRSSRFDEEALTQAVATQSRAQNALEQWRQRGGLRTLAFCCSTGHADFMADFFAAADVPAVAVHSGRSSAPRSASLKRLKSGDVQVVFAVDMFNEGVDLPNVDTVMMLRPTESRVLWLQQFGRGLRHAEGKDRLTVIDYIGNHRTFLIKPQTLLGLPDSDAAVDRALQRAEAQTIQGLPPGCEVTYELRALEILRALLRVSGPEALLTWYTDFRERHGARPRAVEAFHDGYAPRAARRAYGSWLGFVAHMGDLDDSQTSVSRHITPGSSGSAPGGLLAELETTPMTRSYKMLVLQAMLNDDRLPGEVGGADLAAAVARLAERSARLQADLGVPLTDLDALRRHLEQNPIKAWCEGAGTGGASYFGYDHGVFASRFRVPADERAAFQALAAELVEWRLAEYLARIPEDSPSASEDRIVCTVSHAGGRPILFLPDRSASPGIPEGTVRVTIDGDPHEAHFVKVAVNVIRKSRQTHNVLPALMRAWFGPNAGRPGTSFSVAFERHGDDWHLVPIGERPSPTAGAETWRQYPRERIPGLFGLPFSTAAWNQGFVFKGSHIVLLVTLDKSGKGAEHQYQDRFLSAEVFEWQSPNKHHRAGKIEEKMPLHADLGLHVHLFVRRAAKVNGSAAPFLYCGDCDFASWEGDRPITVRWRLRQPLPDRWQRALGLPASRG